jgi:hypothetical protein
MRIFSLIYDLEGDSPPIRAAASFDLGTVIDRLGRKWIVIGSGDQLGAKETFKAEEIRCIVLRRDDIWSVRKVFEGWVQRDTTLEDGKEMVLKAVLATKDPDSAIVTTGTDEMRISLLLENIALQARFQTHNLIFIDGLELTRGDALRGANVYVLGHVRQLAPNQWEILGRAMILA